MPLLLFAYTRCCELNYHVWEAGLGEEPQKRGATSSPVPACQVGWGFLCLESKVLCPSTNAITRHTRGEGVGPGGLSGPAGDMQEVRGVVRTSYNSNSPHL